MKKVYILYIAIVMLAALSGYNVITARQTQKKLEVANNSIIELERKIKALDKAGGELSWEVDQNKDRIEEVAGQVEDLEDRQVTVQTFTY